MKLLSLLLIATVAFPQAAPLTVTAPPRTLPQSVSAKLSASDRVLFDKLMRVGLEAAWSAVTSEGYPQCFINELTPLNTDRRIVGRARTIRYLPNRKDLRDKIYASGPQLNYRSAEEAQPGDILVFDAGGETRSDSHRRHGNHSFCRTWRLWSCGGRMHARHPRPGRDADRSVRALWSCFERQSNHDER